MKKFLTAVLIISLSFTMGFAVKSVLVNQKPKDTMAKVTGIGGIFFKSKDPKQLKEWYSKNLGINASDYGAMFEWYEQPDSTTKASTSWNPFSETTKYFAPSEKDFMINYRVQNIEALVDELRKNNVTVLDSIETYDYGKFVHIMDLEGNKIELWEPMGE